MDNKEIDSMNYAAFGARIRKLRQTQGLSQEQLSERTGISLSFLGNIERGTRKPGLGNLVAICNALGCTSDALLLDSLSAVSMPPVPERLSRQRQDVMREIFQTMQQSMDAWGKEK